MVSLKSLTANDKRPFMGVSLIHKKTKNLVNRVSVQNKINTAVNIHIRLENRTIWKAWKKPRYIGLGRDEINSEYEWYLQKSMLNRIYEMYTKFSRLTERKPVYENFGSIRADTVLRGEARHGERPVSMAESIAPTSHLQSNKKIEVENLKTGAEMYGAINSRINMEQIAALVGKDIESKLRLERLKKGY